jgi:hypothetical protein
VLFSDGNKVKTFAVVTNDWQTEGKALRSGLEKGKRIKRPPGERATDPPAGRHPGPLGRP